MTRVLQSTRRSGRRELCRGQRPTGLSAEQRVEPDDDRGGVILLMRIQRVRKRLVDEVLGRLLGALSRLEAARDGLADLLGSEEVRDAVGDDGEEPQGWGEREDGHLDVGGDGEVAVPEGAGHFHLVAAEVAVGLVEVAVGGDAELAVEADALDLVAVVGGVGDGDELVDEVLGRVVEVGGEDGDGVPRPSEGELARVFEHDGDDARGAALGVELGGGVAGLKVEPLEELLVGGGVEVAELVGVLERGGPLRKRGHAGCRGGLAVRRVAIEDASDDHSAELSVFHEGEIKRVLVQLTIASTRI